jgi:transcriptional regulator with XRE-family HTH domain
MEFGPYVKRERESRKLGLRDLAEQLGISPAYVSRVEHGTLDPTEEVVVKWAKALGQDPDFMMALLGRIRADLVQQIKRNPGAYGQLLKSLRGLKAPSINRVAQAAREVKEGNW